MGRGFNLTNVKALRQVIHPISQCPWTLMGKIRKVANKWVPVVTSLDRSWTPSRDKTSSFSLEIKANFYLPSLRLLNTASSRQKRVATVMPKNHRNGSSSAHCLTNLDYNGFRANVWICSFNCRCDNYWWMLSVQEGADSFCQTKHFVDFHSSQNQLVCVRIDHDVE